MTFLHGTLLAAMAAVVLPLLIQQFGRTRTRDVAWGAMMFLHDAPAEPSGSALWRERLLVAIRMLMIAALALALAQPVTADATAAQGAGFTVIVIDRSGSMSVDAGGKSRLESARQTALNVLAALPAGDEAAVVFTPEAFGTNRTSDFQQLAARIGDVRQSSGRADLAGALNTAARLIGGSRVARRNLFVIADRQATTYRDMNDAFAATWKAQLSGTASPNARFVAVGSPVGNVALQGVELIDASPIVGKPFYVDIKLANYAVKPRADLSVDILRGEQAIDHCTVSLSANGAVRLRRSITLNAVGSQLLSVKIADDAYALDNTLDFATTIHPAGTAPASSIDQNLLPGDPIIADLPNALADSFAIDAPGGGSLDVVPTERGMQARFSATGRAGVYRVRYRTAAGPQVLHFVVRGARDESDLDELPAAEFNRVLDAFGFRTVSDTAAGAIGSELNPTRIEPWLLLICLCVLLAITESILSRRWLTPLIGATA